MGYGFSTRLIGAGGISLVGEDCRMLDVRYPCLALQEFQLCRGCSYFIGRMHCRLPVSDFSWFLGGLVWCYE